MNAARRVAQGVAVVALISCAGAEPPPAPPPAPVVTAAPAPPAVRLGLLDPAPPEAPPTSPPAEPTPYPNAFAGVPLPPGTPAISAVVGRAADDVWMVAANSEILRWDGARVHDEGRPRCHADTCCGHLVDCARQPRRCAANCKGQWGECAAEVDFGYISVEKGEIVVRASICLGGLTCAIVESRRGKNGRWTCEQPGNEGMIPTVERRLSPSVRLETPNHAIGGLQGDTSVVTADRRLPLPEGLEKAELGLAATADDDLWLIDPASPRMWHGNGLTWTPVATGLVSQSDVWVSEGALWVLGVGDGADVLLRRDLARETWDRFAAKDAERSLRSAAPGFWLLGLQAYYHWNGRGLSRIEAPPVVAQQDYQTWLGSAGDLWVVGASPSAKVKGDVPAGVAFRLPPEKRP